MRLIQSAIPLALPFSSAAPLHYLSGVGDPAASIVPLTWGVLLISLAVIVIIALLLAGAIWRRPSLAWRIGEKVLVLPEAGGLNWLWIGVGLSALALLVTVVWTVKVLADIQSPPRSPTLSIEVTGKQWWWQVRYKNAGDGNAFVTANEIHIPVGVPVRLTLVGGDVIHSFWVPQLAGKMDAIPGQINQTWIAASKPGVFRGQCTEYCGLQHSKMALRVIAQPENDFRAWWAHQLEPPKPQGQAIAGRKEFLNYCGNCHAVRGTEAAGTFGPDLSHLMQRGTLASGVLPNDDASLRQWVADPQSLKPGNLMPVLPLSPQERADIHAYLKGLT